MHRETRFAGEWQPIVFDEPDLNPDHHNHKDDKPLHELGYEGATLVKANDKYAPRMCMASGSPPPRHSRAARHTATLPCSSPLRTPLS